MGIAIAMISAFVGGALWLNNSLNRIDRRLELIETSVKSRFTAQDMRLWVMQFQINNPTLKVPTVEAVLSTHEKEFP